MSSPPKASPSPSPPASPTSALRPLGKVRSPSKTRVSFAADVLEHHDETAHTTDDEHTPLLNNKSPDGEEEGEESADHLTSLPSRLHRKLKRGLTIGRAKMRKPGQGLPMYRNGNLVDHHEEDDYMTTQRALLYCVLALIAIALVLGAFVLVQSTEHNPTGPYPHPPIHTKPHPTHVLPTGIPPPPFPSGMPRNPAFLVKGSNGAVATENKDCSTMGIDILKEGGNAVDAAIASTLCIGTVNMFSSGIGGGGFMAVRVPWYSTLENDPQSSPDSNSTVWTIDFRETTPAAGNSTMFGDDPFKSLFGGLSVGVPGEIRGLAEAHARWGRLPWKQLVMPSAHIARGWRVGKELDKRLKWLGSFMHHSRDWAPIFAPTGHLLTEGELIKRTTYAHTLSIIAKEGPDAFYSSSSKIARAIVRKVQSEGGIMTQEDLEGYKPVVEQALEGSYRGKKIWVTGAPSSGPVLLHILNLLELFDLSEGPTPLNIHRIVEAMKFGFAARTRISDPVSNADIKRMADIHTKEYAKEIFPRITDNITHTPDYYNPVFDVPTDHGTTHLSVVDKDGMAVSITSTINLVWGSRVLDQATGIIFNDELDDFSRPGMPNAFGLPPSPYNYASPNKRPLSSTSPVIMETASGEFYAALGGSGGSRIFGAVLQVILNLEWGMDASKAVEEPRVHDQLYPLETSVESGFNEATMESLKAKGHNITVFDINLGVAEVQAVVKDPKTGEFSAASDSRKNGIADAF